MATRVNQPLPLSGTRNRLDLATGFPASRGRWNPARGHGGRLGCGHPQLAPRTCRWSGTGDTGLQVVAAGLDAAIGGIGHWPARLYPPGNDRVSVVRGDLG